MQRLNNRAVVFTIFLLALVLRFWGFAEPKLFIGDEFQFVPSAQKFFSTGLYEPNGWLHPPLNFHITMIGENLFGNNPYGWRLLNVLFGSISVLMLMLLAQRLFPDVRIGWLAGVLFAVEPFHILISRTNFVEIVPVFFFLIFIYAVLLFLQGNTRALALSGIPLGLAIAGKWYFVLPAAFTALLVMIDILRSNENRIGKCALLLSSSITAFAVYMLLFYPWFQRGSGLADFFIWQYDAYRVLQTLTISDFLDGFFRASPSVPWHWFIKPLIVADPIVTYGSWGNFFIIMNNPPVWLLVLPAFLYLGRLAWRSRETSLVLVLVLFFSSYIQFVIVRRPVFLYSSFAVLPFAYLLIARALAELTGRSERGNYVFLGVLCAALIWGVYLYPFVTSRMVPIALYQHLLPAMPFPPH